MMRKTLSMLLTAVFLTGAAGAMCLGAAAEPWMLSLIHI